MLRGQGNPSEPWSRADGSNLSGYSLERQPSQGLNAFLTGKNTSWGCERVHLRLLAQVADEGGVAGVRPDHCERWVAVA